MSRESLFAGVTRGRVPERRSTLPVGTPKVTEGYRPSLWFRFSMVRVSRSVSQPVRLVYCVSPTKQGREVIDSCSYAVAVTYAWITSKVAETSTVAALSAVRNHTGRVVGDFGVRSNVWLYETGKWKVTKDARAYDHPAIFPEALANDHIRSWSNPGDLILDPMCGSGTTLKMARKNGCKAIGIDISEEYCELTVNRLRQEVFSFEETA